MRIHLRKQFFESWLRVIARKGEVQVVNGLDVRIASSNMKLNGMETIILGDDAYLSLVDEKGRTAELQQPGKYDLRTVLAGQRSVKEGTAFRFANYLLDRMTAEGKKNRLGAMSYFIRSESAETEPIQLYIPGVGKYYQDQLVLSWEDAPGGGPYIVEISNMYQELLQTAESSHNSIRLTIDKKLDVQGILLIKVRNKEGFTSEPYALKRLGSFHREDLSADLLKLEHVYSSKDAVNRFIMAGFFEYHNLLADALTCYLQAIEASPDVSLYREAYEDFLLRNHLIRL